MADGPRDLEGEYFRLEELEKLRRKRHAQSKGLAEEERSRAKALHWMHCPKCGMELHEADFRDVKVDTCFACGGMYLDRGEIEKVLAYKERGWFEKWVRVMTGIDSGAE